MTIAKLLADILLQSDRSASFWRNRIRYLHHHRHTATLSWIYLPLNGQSHVSQFPSVLFLHLLQRRSFSITVRNFLHVRCSSCHQPYQSNEENSQLWPRSTRRMVSSRKWSHLAYESSHILFIRSVDARLQLVANYVNINTRDVETHESLHLSSGVWAFPLARRLFESASWHVGELIRNLKSDTGPILSSSAKLLVEGHCARSPLQQPIYSSQLFIFTLTYS